MVVIVYERHLQSQNKAWIDIVNVYQILMQYENELQCYILRHHHSISVEFVGLYNLPAMKHTSIQFLDLESKPWHPTRMTDTFTFCYVGIEIKPSIENFETTSLRLVCC